MASLSRFIWASLAMLDVDDDDVVGSLFLVRLWTILSLSDDEGDLIKFGDVDDDDDDDDKDGDEVAVVVVS